MIRRLVSTLALATAVAWPGIALAQQPAEADPADGKDRAFRYTSSVPKDYIRAALQEVLVLGGGLVEYGLNTNNQEDQNLGYTWRDFRGKLVFDTVSFDNNRFGTNWLSHPGAGFLFYQAARSNRLSLLESFAISFATSTLWELVAELREKVAANDMIVTPISGFALGEASLQLGSFFHRSHSPIARAIGGTLFAPLKTLDDKFDRLTPLPASRVDDIGLDDEGWHRFTIGGSAGITKQRDGRTWSDGRIDARTRLVTLPGYAREGDHDGAFVAGEVSSLHVSATTSNGGLVDLDVGGSVMPAGWYMQHAHIDERGRLRGHGLLAGLLIDAEYTHHDWARSEGRPGNLIANVDAGVAFEHALHAGPVVLRTNADALLAFAGVESFALPAYRRAHGDEGLTSVLARWGYHHATGASLRPRLEATLGAFDASASMRIDLFRSVKGFDVEGIAGTRSEVVPSDSRTVARATLGASPSKHVRLHVDAERRTRAGQAGDQTESATEGSLLGGVEVVF